MTLVRVKEPGEAWETIVDPVTPAASSFDGEQLLIAANGWLSWNYHPVNIEGSQAVPADGPLGSLIPVQGGQQITHVVVDCSLYGAGTGAEFYVGLYDTGLNQLAASSNVASSLMSNTGAIALPLDAGYTPGADDVLWSVILQHGQNNTRDWELGGNTNFIGATSNQGAPGGSPVWAAFDVVNWPITALPASFSVVQPSTFGASFYWMALMQL